MIVTVELGKIRVIPEYHTVKKDSKSSRALEVVYRNITLKIKFCSAQVKLEHIRIFKKSNLR